MMRIFLAAVYLLTQIGMIIHGRFVQGTYFSWAPHDSQSKYRIRAEINGRDLSEQEIEQRYRVSQSGVEPHDIYHILREIRVYEERRGKGEHVTVEVKYRVNGGPVQEWRLKTP